MGALWLALLLCGTPQTDEWQAPEQPDPTKILTEARNDAERGRYAVALQKFLWFHRNAVRYNRGLSAVRRSFALSSWLQLADEYPPALEALRQARGEALERAKAALSPMTAVDAFSDFAAINRSLREESETVEAFRRLDQERPELAPRVLMVARPALIQAKEYALAAKYIDSDMAWRFTIDLYRRTRTPKQDGGPGPDLAAFSEKRFANEAETIVALLTLAGRHDEATRIAEEARREKSDPAFTAALDEALGGKVPPPWP